MVQLKRRRESLGESVTVSGQSTANGTCQVTMAVEISLQIRTQTQVVKLKSERRDFIQFH